MARFDFFDKRQSTKTLVKQAKLHCWCHSHQIRPLQVCIFCAAVVQRPNVFISGKKVAFQCIAYHISSLDCIYSGFHLDQLRQELFTLESSAKSPSGSIHSNESNSLNSCSKQTNNSEEAFSYVGEYPRYMLERTALFKKGFILIVGQLSNDHG